MKGRILTLFLFFAALATAEEKKPFENVLVLSGGSLRSAAFLGAIEGAIESGYPPSAILPTCGAGLAAAIANSTNDPTKWREVIESPEFYEYMKSVRVNPNFTSAKPVLTGLLGLKGNQLYSSFTGRPDAMKIPDLYSQHAVDLPLESFTMKFLDREFNPDGIPIIVVAGRLNYDQDDVGKQVNGKKLFTESYFTDSKTAEHLIGKTSGPGEQYPNAYISKETTVYTGVSLYDAIRASMSEPNLVEQKTILINGKPVRFSAGSINGYPIDLAMQLGEHVVATASGPQGDPENIVYQSAFGIPLDERYARVQSLPIDHWIDFTDWGPMDQMGEFGPKLNVKKLMFEDNFPESHEEFWDTSRRLRLRSMKAFDQS